MYKALAMERGMRIKHLETASSQQGPVTDVPDEMLYVVFGFLPLVDLLKCERYPFTSSSSSFFGGLRVSIGSARDGATVSASGSK
jgi:hypothetical protein